MTLQGVYYRRVCIQFRDRHKKRKHNTLKGVWGYEYSRQKQQAANACTLQRGRFGRTQGERVRQGISPGDASSRLTPLNSPDSPDSCHTYRTVNIHD